MPLQQACFKAFHTKKFTSSFIYSQSRQFGYFHEKSPYWWLLKFFFLQITCWASSDNSWSSNHTKNGCPGIPGLPQGMPDKVRELQLSNGLQPRTAAQIANEPQKLEYLWGPSIYKSLSYLIELRKLEQTFLSIRLEWAIVSARIHLFLKSEYIILKIWAANI